MASNADTPPSAPLTRRSWASWLLGTSLGATLFAFLYPVLNYLVPPESSEPSLSEFELDLKASDIAPNSGRIVPIGGKPVLLLRRPSGELAALTATCTHLDCTVQFRADRSDVWCACHNGTYDLKGRNISGPPPRPLTPLEVYVRGEKIVIKRA
ncbi:MAG TPA: Rieske (2Fe-2S) protein [Thermoanaerobaculia bacterium]|nr:Rieske (2Fe-2S) protein [Thermoanaerobaculia bacterium]